MRYCAAILAALLLVACSDPTPDYERMRRSTVQIIVEIKGEAKGHGSGVLVEQGVLTAAHIANIAKNDKTRLLVKFKDEEFVHAKLSKSEWAVGDDALDTDLALLSVPTSSGYPLSQVNCNPTPVGAAVYVSGHPGKVRWSVTEGIVISDTHREGWTAGRWLQTDAAVSGGNSGGPMFNARGEVIGIVSHGQTAGYAPTGHHFGQSGPVICGFLNSVKDDEVNVIQVPAGNAK